MDISDAHFFISIFCILAGSHFYKLLYLETNYFSQEKAFEIWKKKMYFHANKLSLLAASGTNFLESNPNSRLKNSNFL